MQDLTKNLLVIDIETVSGSEDIQSLSPEIQKHWERKASYIRNVEEKDWKDLYTERAAIYAEFGKIIVIGVGYMYQESGEHFLRVKSFSGTNEQTLLMDFKEFLETKFDQENLRLCAHNGKEFDFPYLCRRMLINNIKIPYSLNMTGKKPWEVNHVDTMELWKFGDWKSFTSLDLLTTIFNIPSSKSMLDGSRVTETYYHEENGLEKIAQYCQGDVIATSQLYLKLNNYPLIKEENITFVN
jgi:hypothetical protein